MKKLVSNVFLLVILPALMETVLHPLPAPVPQVIVGLTVRRRDVLGVGGGRGASSNVSVKMEVDVMLLMEHVSVLWDSMEHCVKINAMREPLVKVAENIAIVPQVTLVII